MPSRYYHCEATRMVIEVPDLEIREDKAKKGKWLRRTGWQARSVQRVTRADNYLKPDGRWQYEVERHIRQPFEARYSEEDVRHYFDFCIPSGCTEITEAEYSVLQKRYDQQAHANKPPRE